MSNIHLHQSEKLLLKSLEYIGINCKIDLCELHHIRSIACRLHIGEIGIDKDIKTMELNVNNFSKGMIESVLSSQCFKDHSGKLREEIKNLNEEKSKLEKEISELIVYKNYYDLTLKLKSVKNEKP